MIHKWAAEEGIMTNLPEPIPQAVVRAREAIRVAIATTDIGSGRLLNAVITEALEALRAETITELVRDAVRPCPECEAQRQMHLDYVGRP